MHEFTTSFQLSLSLLAAFVSLMALIMMCVCWQGTIKSWSKFHAISCNGLKGSFVRIWGQIPWGFHVIYPGFISFPCSNMTWILDKFKSGNFHDISWENDGICVVFLPNCLQKDMNTFVSHFRQGFQWLWWLKFPKQLCTKNMENPLKTG